MVAGRFDQFISSCRNAVQALEQAREEAPDVVRQSPELLMRHLTEALLRSVQRL